MGLRDIKIPDDPKRIHHLLYVFFLIGVVACMPLSKYMTSLFQFLLIIHWLIRGDYHLKWERLKSNPAIWVLLLFFFIPLLGMLYTQNIDFGLKDLKIKLPLLALPLIIGTSGTITRKELKLVLFTFSASVSISTLVSLGIITGIIPYNYTDIREASLFISHIRLALLTDMSMFILSFYALRKGISLIERVALFTWSAYMLVYLLAVNSMTGLVVGLFVGFILAVRWAVYQKKLYLKWISIIAIIAAPILIAIYVSTSINSFYTIRQDIQSLDKQTELGNLYWHDISNKQLENGYYIGLYVCEKELRESWNAVSDIKYDGKDKKNQDIQYTIIRYLTSLGLPKDAYGISKLQSDDINLIEEGYANYIYKKRNRFEVRMYELIWEIDVYKKGGNPSGHSVTQRIEYLRTGFSILRDHPLLGVGTGDVPDAFDRKYEENRSPLELKWRLRAHNQWLTFGISFGLIGALILIMAFILPGIMQKKLGQYFFLLFFLVAFLSMFNEDTLETQAGVAFFAFFYPFLLFSPNHER